MCAPLWVGCAGSVEEPTLPPVPEGVGEIDPACYGKPPKLVVGGGDSAFEALPSGAEVTMVHGPQGGWHVVGSARVTYLRDVVNIDYTLWARLEGGLVAVGEGSYRVGLLMEGICQGSYPGMFAYLDVSALAEGERDTPPELLTGVPGVMSMTAWDSDGSTAIGSLEVVFAPDPIDVKAQSVTDAKPERAQRGGAPGR